MQNPFRHMNRNQIIAERARFFMVADKMTLAEAQKKAIEQTDGQIEMAYETALIENAERAGNAYAASRRNYWDIAGTSATLLNAPVVARDLEQQAQHIAGIADFNDDHAQAAQQYQQAARLTDRAAAAIIDNAHEEANAENAQRNDDRNDPSHVDYIPAIDDAPDTQGDTVLEMPELSEILKTENDPQKLRAIMGSGRINSGEVMSTLKTAIRTIETTSNQPTSYPTMKGNEPMTPAQEVQYCEHVATIETRNGRHDSATVYTEMANAQFLGHYPASVLPTRSHAEASAHYFAMLAETHRATSRA